MEQEAQDKANTANADERLEQWIRSATQYFVLTNAGAAVAVLSFIGASGHGFPKLAVISLACFVVALCLAGAVMLGQLTAAYREWLSTELDPLGAHATITRIWTTRLWSKVEPLSGRFLTAAFGLFALGSLMGLIGLMLW